MRVAPIVVAACWSGPVAAPEQPQEVRVRRCEVRDTDLTSDGTVKLATAGLAFAELTNATLLRFDVSFTGAIGHARLETAIWELAGELDLSEMPIRPNVDVLHAGWLEVKDARPRSATGDVLTVEVELPEGLEPAAMSVPLPCHDLTFQPAPVAEDTGDLDLVSLPIGTKLHAVPAGPEVARVIGRVDPDDASKTARPVTANVLERRGGRIQVRIEGSNAVIAWVSATAAHPPVGGLLGGFGYGRSGYSRPSYRCSRDIPIFVQANGRATRVGRVKADASFYLMDDSSGSDPAIDLGMAKPDTRPYLRATDFASCR